MAVKPREITLRCFGVGFGDCFLLTFHYDGTTGDRHMLIDCGCTQKPPGAPANLMKKIINGITEACGGQLHAIVATHRHTDHISGFATNANGKGPGDLIAALKPQLVIQPWTEKLDEPVNAKAPSNLALNASANEALRFSLRRMNDVGTMMLKEIGNRPAGMAADVKFMAEEFVGEGETKNLSAVKQLAVLGKAGTAAFVHYGSKVPKLKTLFPGVVFDILGPPTIAQKASVASMTDEHPREFWHFARFWGMHGATAEMTLGDGGDQFPNAPTFKRSEFPCEARWFVGRVRKTRIANLFRIVHSMDDAMNNTSVILLIRAGNKKLLFPGDAQWENWEYALSRDAELLKDVDLYKVGHHGSLNATPKTLWNLFAKKSRKAVEGRLTTVMSTVTNSKHGHRESGTEVPRDVLVQELRSFSTLRTTQELEATDDDDVVMKIPIKLS